jgi:hypothetical protein
MSGVKMIIELGQFRQLSQQIIYLQTDRKRIEFQNFSGQLQVDGSLRPTNGPRLATITRCDLAQSFELNLDDREYRSTPYPPRSFTHGELARRGLDHPTTYVSDKPTLLIEITTTDTGERKDVFGFNARHVITRRKQTPLEGSSSTPQESVTDGWYIDSKMADTGIDLYQRLSCDRPRPAGKRDYAYSYLRAGGESKPIDRPEFVTIGEPETGFALNSVVTWKSEYVLPDGSKKKHESRFESHVVEFEARPIDPALFEIPPGFKPVDHIARNPAATLANPPNNFWERVRVLVAALFNRR